jgi:S-phase kinase-associated protein 1
MSDSKDAKEAKGDEKGAKEEVKGLDDGSENESLTLVSQEKEKFTVPKKVALQSELVKTMAEGDKDETEIPLPNVKGAVLSKVVTYLKYHVADQAKEIEKPLKSANMNEVVSQWDADFVDVDQELLFELILAANYMDIKPLLDLTCAKVASMIKGKTPEQIRKTFNIVNDFTPEEEEAVRAENKWAEES